MSPRSTDEPDRASSTVLLWLFHAPIVTEPVLPPSVVLGSVPGILLLPLFSSRIGVPAVVAAIAAVGALLIALVCCAPDWSRHPRSSRG